MGSLCSTEDDDRPKNKKKKSLSGDADDFVRFAQAIKMMPSETSHELYDYGITFDFLPTAKGKFLKKSRFPCRFSKRGGFHTTLVHRRFGDWSFEPPLPDVAEEKQTNDDVYMLLDDLREVGWVHAPHRQQFGFEFTAILQHLVDKHGFSKSKKPIRMNRKLYAQLFPKIPDDDEEEVIQVPKSMKLPPLSDGEEEPTKKKKSGTYAEMPAN
jgi:hypothetical protein